MGRKLRAAMWVALLAAGTACVCLAVHSQRGQALQAAQDRASRLARVVGGEAGKVLGAGDVSGAYRLLQERFAEDRGVVRATLYDRRGSALSSFEAPLPGSTGNGPAEVRRAEQTVMDRGRPVGALAVVMGVPALSAGAAGSLVRAALACLGVVILCALWALKLQMRVAQPLARLSHAMQRVGAEGGLAQRLSYSADDELTGLFDHFNGMVSQLDARARERDRSQRWLNTLIGLLPDRVFVFAADGREIRVLQKVHDGVETPTRVPTGATLDVLLPAEAAKRVAAGIEDSLRERERVRLDYEVDGEDESVRSFEAELIPMEPTEEDDETALVLMVARDVTERLHLQEQFLRSQKMEAVGQLAGGVAHDFNNLLAGIMGYAEMLKHGFDPARAAGQILQTSERASDLVRQLLTFSRKGSTKHEPTDVNVLVERVKGILAHTLDPRIQLECQLTTEDCHVLGDASQLESAVLNLAVNARDAMPEGGELTLSTRIIELGTREAEQIDSRLGPGSYLEVGVRDTGFGISDDVRPRIFEPFFTTKEAGKGTGLGLAAVYGTAISHKGAVTLHSQAGHGCAFRIFVPRFQGEAQLARSGEIPHGHGRLLLVDDEEVVRLTAKELLASLGYSVLTFGRPLEALAYFQAHHREVDGVILDMVMPQMNGAELADRLRSIDPNVRILIASGYVNLDEAAGRQLPMLSKPFSLSDLATAVSSLLSRQPLERHALQASRNA